MGFSVIQDYQRTLIRPQFNVPRFTLRDNCRREEVTLRAIALVALQHVHCIQPF